MIRIICSGKIKEKYLSDLINDYLKRINKYHKLEIVEILDTDIITEGKNIISKLKDRSYKVALSIKGEKINSVEMANLINKKLMDYSNIDFIIGSSYGLSDEVLSKVDYELSFGDLTFPHGLFRGILLEQIYRSFKIINNESYHK